jgi:hypothetical protein
LKPEEIVSKLVFSLFLLAIPALLCAQEAGTSLEEYRYISRGYAYQKDIGLDTRKEGYELVSLFQAHNGVKITGLFESNSGTAKALIYEIPKKDQGSLKYYGVPRPDSPKEVLDLFETDRRSLQDESRLKYEEAERAFIFASLENRVSPETLRRKEGSSSVSTYQSGSEGSRLKGVVDQTGFEAKPATAEGVEVKTRIEGSLQQRPLKEKAQLKNQSGAGGRVAIKICVNGAGEVVYARFSQKGSTTILPELTSAAERTAYRYRFTPSELKEECGTILFDFE